MPSDTCSKPIMYYRVSFLNNPSLAMSELLHSAHELLPLATDRIFETGEQEFKGCKVESKGSRHYVHVTVVTRGRPTLSVPDLKGAKEINPRLKYPSDDEEFMDSDMFFMFEQNHMLFCSSGLKISKAREYIIDVFNKTGQPEEYSNFIIHKIADIDKIRLIRQGVKEINLGCSLYPETLSYESRQSVKINIFSKVFGSIQALCAKEPQLEHITEDENISAEIILKFNRTKRGGEIGKARMSSLSEQLIGEDEDGFRIKTFDGTVISAQDTMVKKIYKI